MDGPDPHRYGVRPPSFHTEETVDSLAHTAAALLDKEPAPALTLDELRERLEAEDPCRVPGRDHLLRTLQAHPDRLRILLRPQRGWLVEIGPVAWVLTTRHGRAEARSIRSIYERLRSTVIALGQEVEPGSMRSWAGWNRLVEEEGQLRDALLRARKG